MILFFFLHILDIEHEIKITPPCEETSKAGDNHTLTCTVNSELPANLTWVRIVNGEQVKVVNTPNITVSAQTVSDRITKRSITFNPLLTSHAGQYVCVSVLNSMGPKALGTKELECAVNVKSKYCYGLHYSSLCIQN